MKKSILAVAAIIISSRLLAQQDSIIVETDGIFKNPELTRVVVTATRYPLKQSETGKVLTVITREQLDRQAGLSVMSILNRQPGISVNGASNNPGTVQTLNIRGAAAGNALVLIDGIPVNDPSVIYNYFDLNLLAVDQIERIEIMKGGQSTLYGSDAVAGIINIITRKAGSKKISGFLNSQAGSYGMLRNSAGINGTLQSSKYQLQITDQRAKGFSSAYDSGSIGHFDRDDYNQQTISGNWQTQLSKKLSLKAGGQYSRYETGLDAGAFHDDKDFSATSRNAQVMTGLAYTFPKGALNLNYQYNSMERVYTDDSMDKSSAYAFYSKGSFKGNSHFAELYGNYTIKNVRLLAGVDLRKHTTTQDYFSFGIFGPYSSHLDDSLAHMQQVSGFASVLFKAKSLSLEAGGRLNHHSVYGDNFTYTFNPSYLIQQRVKLFVNLYSAYKTPTLYQLFDAYSGNMDLKPEESNIAEAGAEYYHGRAFHTRLVWFSRNTKHAIQYITIDPFNFISHYENINSQKSNGLEWDASLKAGKWNIETNYTYTTGKLRTNYDPSGNKLASDTSFNNLYRIPKHAFNISVQWQANPKLGLEMASHTVSDRLELVYGEAPKVLQAYTTIDLRGQYKLNAHWRFFVNVENLTNTEYFDILGYNSRRFNAAAGFLLNF